MKILRFKKDGKEAVGILKDRIVCKVSSSIGNILQNGSTPESGNSYPLKEVKILPPVYPSKVVCVGLNYRDHAEELNMALPEEPVLFLKPPTTVIGNGTPIIYPPQSRQVDYEAELAVIVGRTAHKISIENAADYIAGYTVLNDVTARDLQQKDGQWTRAKSFDTFCPLGPWMETDLNPSNQKHIMTLLPGDVIATGTPPGVGQLQVGDVAEATVDGVGTLSNQVKII